MARDMGTHGPFNCTERIGWGRQETRTHSLAVKALRASGRDMTWRPPGQTDRRSGNSVSTIKFNIQADLSQRGIK